MVGGQTTECRLHVILEHEEIAGHHTDLLSTRHVGWSRGTSDPKQRVNNISPSAGSPNGKIEYIVWSDVFRCSSCLAEVIYWDLIFAGPGKPIRKDLVCKHCSSVIAAKDLQRVWTESLDIEMRKPLKDRKTHV